MAVAALAVGAGSTRGRVPDEVACCVFFRERLALWELSGLRWHVAQVVA